MNKKNKQQTCEANQWYIVLFHLHFILNIVLSFKRISPITMYQSAERSVMKTGVPMSALGSLSMKCIKMSRTSLQTIIVNIIVNYPEISIYLSPVLNLSYIYISIEQKSNPACIALSVYYNMQQSPSSFSSSSSSTFYPLDML